MSSTSQAGKGDAPRNCFSKEYRNNYDNIIWNHNKNEKNNTTPDVNNDDGLCSPEKSED